MILSIVLQTNLDPDSVIDIIFSFWLDVLLVQGFATKVEQKDPDLVQGDIACTCCNEYSQWQCVLRIDWQWNMLAHWSLCMASLTRLLLHIDYLYVISQLMVLISKTAIVNTDFSLIK